MSEKIMLTRMRDEDAPFDDAEVRRSVIKLMADRNGPGLTARVHPDVKDWATQKLIKLAKARQERAPCAYIDALREVVRDRDNAYLVFLDRCDPVVRGSGDLDVDVEAA